MKCVYHADRDAFSTCAHCGKTLCSECTVELNGYYMCKHCVAALAGREKYPKPKNPSKFWLFVLSTLPGLGYMYLGLIKRGLFVMTTFFLTIFLMSELRVSLLGFLIPIIFFAAFFDGFAILRRIKAGEDVPDQVEDFKSFIADNKKIIFGGLGLMLLFNLFNNFFCSYGYYTLKHGISWLLVRALPAVVLIGIGLYFFSLKKGKHCRHHKHHEDGLEENQDNDIIDKR